MRIVKWLGIVVLALAAVLLVGGLLLPSTFKVERSVRIDAPAGKVYPLVASPRNWPQWSVWHKRDPNMKLAYGGPDSGSGAKWAWTSGSEGDGSMLFTAAEADRRVAYEMTFADFGTTSPGEFRFAPDGAATRVTWTMNGDMGRNPLFHWIALMADGMVGKDFEAGLAGLKEAAEKR